MSLLCQHIHLHRKPRGEPAPFIYGSLAPRKSKARDNFTEVGTAGMLAGHITPTQQPRGADRKKKKSFFNWTKSCAGEKKKKKKSQSDE